MPLTRRQSIIIKRWLKFSERTDQCIRDTGPLQPPIQKFAKFPTPTPKKQNLSHQSF
jgi:hypothetical protein